MLCLGKRSERECLPLIGLSRLVPFIADTLSFSLTEDYNLELQYRRPFLDIWEDEKDDRELGPLSERMGVRDRVTGSLNMTEEEKEAVSKYHLALLPSPVPISC